MKRYLLPLLLAGCSGYSPPPPTPQPLAIKQIADTMNAIDMPTQDYVAYGTTLAGMNCADWFGAQIARSSRMAAEVTELGLLGTAAGMAGVVASGPAAPATAAVMALGAGTIANLGANSPTGTDPLAAYVLTSKKLRAWRDAAGTPLTKAEAFAQVADYAAQCQLPEIRRAIVEAVMTAPVAANQPATQAFGLETPRRPLLPDIRVGVVPESAPVIVEPVRPRRKVSHEPPVGSPEWFRQPRFYIRSLDGP